MTQPRAARGTGRIFTTAVERAVEAILARQGVSSLKPIYLHAPLNADQTTSLNGHVEFRDTGDVENGGWQTSGDIVVSTGAGQLAGIFTLPRGRVYLCQAFLAGTFSASTGTLGCQWGLDPPFPFEDPFGVRSLVTPQSQAQDQHGSPQCSAIFDLTADGLDADRGVSVDILNSANLASILDWNSGGTVAIIRAL